MNNPIDLDDPRATATAAHLIARDLATVFRASLPALLGRRTPGGLGVIADRMENDRLFEQFTIGSLDGVLAQCESAVRGATTHRTEWVVARHIAGEEELEAIEVEVRSAEADEIAAVARRIGELSALIRRTEALLAAERYVARRR